MDLCTKLSKRVLDLETTQTNEAMKIDSLKRRVKKLEKKKGLRSHKLKSLYKVSLSARIESSDEEQSLGVLDDEEVVVEKAVVVKKLMLVNINTRPKAKGIVIKEPSEATTTTISITLKVQDK
nr:hypothetical protein [Tanacetum cinerariifolium]